MVEVEGSCEGVCELKASVPTGLEVVASEECGEVVGIPAEPTRGRIAFTIHTLGQLDKVLLGHSTLPPTPGGCVDTLFCISR